MNPLEEIQILEEFRQLINSNSNPDFKELTCCIEKLFDRIFASINTESWNDNQINDFSDLTIDTMDNCIMSVLLWHSQDMSDAKYRLPEEKLKKLKKHFSRIISKNRADLLNLYKVFYVSAYVISINKACEHRKLIQKELQKN